MITHSELGLALAIITGSLISEDAAVWSAASLAISKMLTLKLAALSAVLGVCVGDIALFSVARLVSKGAVRWKWARRLTGSDSVSRVRNRVEPHARWALFFSRAIPGTRLPMTLACGFWSMSLHEFAAVSIAGASVWVAGAFYVLNKVHHRVSTSAFVLVTLAAIILAVGMGQAVRHIQSRFSTTLRRWSRWEFWPGWLFYLPVVAMCAWLALRHRSLSLPALANPGQVNGGIVGESKSQMIADLSDAAPEFVADGYLIPALNAARRKREFDRIVAERALDFPMVLKPEVGQRGAGFRLVPSRAEAHDYLESMPAALIVQRYAAGPREASIFYYRRPFDRRGEILAITEKIFPYVTGDGTRSLEELIRHDDRASLIARTYLQRFSASASHVLPKGLKVRLVEAGNHCQGCIFRDGAHLYTEELRATIDRISQALPGFFIGRYDIRYASDDELRFARSFKIVELNGAASEATSIYDERTSLLSAYRMLYRQWSLVYGIGAWNRKQGMRAPGALALWRSWKDYCEISAFYPAAD